MIRPRPTRAEQTRRTTAGIAFLLGAASAWLLGGALAAELTGEGWTLPHPAVRMPDGIVFEQLPTNRALWWACGVAYFAVWCALVVRPLTRQGPDQRDRGLAGWATLTPLLSASATRKAGRFTRPDLTWRQRRLWFSRVPLTDLGYQLGAVRGTRHQLWANFEIRVRVIARTGWGKSARLLVKIGRSLPGAALIGSTSPDLFEQTVRARQARGLPVVVVDFSDPEHRFAAGFDRVRWNPVRGCRDLHVAQRRAAALVAGAEDGDRSDNDDAFFRNSAMQVIAAWLHAADLGGLDMTAVLRWQQNIHLTDPHDVLERHPAAEPAARLALLKHLDDRAERTTSSVERFIVLALHPFATRDGRDFAVTEDGVDLAQLITSQATVYLLASPATAAAVSPLLTLFADEWLHAARAVALGLPTKRLPIPAVALLDELRTLVPIPSLPVVAYEFRKYGVGLVYAVQNAHQEVELYGPAAESLAQNVQLTLVGGYDQSIASVLTDQAGEARVPTLSTSGRLLAVPEYSQGETYRSVISAADQQQLVDGDAVVRMAGAPLFYARLRSFRQDRGLRRAIGREEASVRADVAAAQATGASQRESSWRHAHASYEAQR